jgi:HAD superfamily hydrolase (TIGR01549 family)
MQAWACQLQAVVFDYGNTLIEFGHRQLDLEREPLMAYLSQFGPVDEDRIQAIRERQILAPYQRDYFENEMSEVCEELLREGMGVNPTTAQVAGLVRCRQEAFVRIVEDSAGVVPLLEKLSRRYKLALVSNYPCGWCIRESMKRLEIDRFFSVIVVSGDPDVRRIKPHPAPYQIMLDRLGIPAERCVYVGDNWLADVQGARRQGMHTILSTQYIPYEKWPRQPGDIDPDATIAHVSDLEGMLLDP